VFAGLKKQALTLEKLLCFHDWLFAEEHDKVTLDPDADDNECLAITKIRELMEDIKLYFPRSQGMGWKVDEIPPTVAFST
jgi:hypothetical protein